MQYKSHSSRDIEIAFSLETPAERINALRRLSNELNREQVSLICRSHSQNLGPGTIRNGQNTPSKGPPINQHRMSRRDPSELDLIAAATNQNWADITGILTDLTGLPAIMIENIFASEEEVVLLMVSRAMNFAWSTVLILMELREKQFLINKNESYRDRIEVISEWYGSHSRHAAARALRFIGAHAQQAADQSARLNELQRA